MTPQKKNEMEISDEDLMKTPIKDVSSLDGYLVKTPSKEANSIEGYLVNLTSPKTESRFNFMIQGKRKCLNFVCFEPEKKKQLTDLLGSPVKVINTKSSERSTDHTFTRKSEILPIGNMDFEILDMQNLKIKDLGGLALECLVTITAAVKTRSREFETSSSLAYQVLSVGDASGVIKIMLWGDEFINTVEEGKSYKFHNVRIKEDKMNGSVYLGTTKSENTSITSCSDLGDVVQGDLHSLAAHESMKGEIFMVNKRMIDYLTCRKCSKKIEGDISGDLVFCKTCDADVKVTKCKKSRVVKVDVEEEVSEKMYHFSIFSNVMDKTLGVDSAGMQQEELRRMLLKLPVLTITHSKKVIQSIEVSS